MLPLINTFAGDNASKADLPFDRLTNSVTVVDPILSIVLRGVSVASVN